MTVVSRNAAVQTHGLTKRYGKKTVVDDLTLSVQPGIVTGFLGPNGAGKSTTMRMILGLDKPTSGAATINGLPIAQLKHPMRTIGALLDARAIHPRRTASDHLLAIAQAGGLGRHRVGEVLDRVGLTSAARRPAGDFSLGMSQRLGIATALLGDPSVLIFDEPLNGLDPEGIRWARTLIRELAAEGRTVLFSSHLMSEMELTADHLVVIGQGRLLADTSLADFIHTHTTQRTLVRSIEHRKLRDKLISEGKSVVDAEDNGLIVSNTSASEVGAIAAQHGIPLDELGMIRDSLEDVFLRMTRDATEYGPTA
jgi:ABC-2 type transport system ATP-binding protein